jgi:hypothetical protein
LAFGGVSSDHASFGWRLKSPGSRPPGSYLVTPEGLEPLGQGSLATDLDATARFISPAAAHVIFDNVDPPSSKPQLEPGAPAAGTAAIYDRSPGGPTRVVSLLPGDVTPAAGQHAAYQGAAPDGSAVVFNLGGTLYVRSDNAETVAIAAAPNNFAGISADGSRVYSPASPAWSR